MPGPNLPDTGASASSSGTSSSQFDFDAMSQFFKRAMGFHGIPQGRLTKFKGTAQSASVEFHNRRQGERESLADFSRSLIRLYNKMETTAPTQEEAKALEKLRNRSLRDQFSAGAREEWVRRELRRISLATKDDGFEEMRKEAIYLFQDGGTHQVTKVREVTADKYLFLRQKLVLP
ncbi:hypothetical protein BSL78_05232 [Apostichopus japonicus]|uniref:Uncharacterized protein n=1 Tax=Stichopus japonicus TaxID=307972 RepID=A0A2G8LC67_STIJA|nr:hypothetical protein BSL78_05232 [Apostichopus japonicus]